MLAVENISLGFHGSLTHSRISSFLGRNKGTCRSRRSSVRRRTSSSSFLSSYEDGRKQSQSSSRRSSYKEDVDVLEIRSGIHTAPNANFSTVDISPPPFESEPTSAIVPTPTQGPSHENTLGNEVITHKIPITPDFGLLPGLTNNQAIAISSAIKDWFVRNQRSSQDAGTRPPQSLPPNSASISKPSDAVPLHPIFQEYHQKKSLPARGRRSARVQAPKTQWFNFGIPYRAPAMPDYDWVQEGGTFDRSQKKMTANEYLELCRALNIIQDNQLPLYQVREDAGGLGQRNPRYTEGAEELSPLRALDRLPWEDKGPDEGGQFKPGARAIQKMPGTDMTDGKGSQVEAEAEDQWHDAQECLDDQPKVEEGEDRHWDYEWVDVQKFLDEDNNPPGEEEPVDQGLNIGWKATAWSLTKGWLKMMAKPW